MIPPEAKEVLDLTNALQHYPLVEKIVLLGFAIVFSLPFVKKRFKKIDEDKAAAEDLRKKDIKIANDHREAQTNAIADLASSMKSLSDAMTESNKENMKRFALSDGRIEKMSELTLQTQEQVRDMNGKILFIEERLQKWPPDLTRDN